MAAPSLSEQAEAHRHHYEVEREIAQRLRGATREERTALYTAAYDELFARVPEHPQLREPNAGPHPGDAADQWRFLRAFVGPHTRLLELGSGDCALASRAAERARSVVALDVSPTILTCRDVPGNVERRLTDGVSLPAADGSASVAYSCQLMEHLHPDDARAQLAEIARVLEPGGTYVCVTPNRLTGPHDVSRYFDEEATGLHLKEYTVTELDALFRSAGFSRVRAYVGTRGWFVRVPLALVRWAERTIERLTAERRRAFRDSPLALPLLQSRLAATK
jgi:SAM-dependent methyltransferase